VEPILSFPLGKQGFAREEPLVLDLSSLTAKISQAEKALLQEAEMGARAACRKKEPRCHLPAD